LFNAHGSGDLLNSRFAISELVPIPQFASCRLLKVTAIVMDLSAALVKSQRLLALMACGADPAAAGRSAAGNSYRVDEQVLACV